MKMQLLENELLECIVHFLYKYHSLDIFIVQALFDLHVSSMHTLLRTLVCDCVTSCLGYAKAICIWAFNARQTINNCLRNTIYIFGKS